MIDFPRWKSLLTILVIFVAIFIVGLDFYKKYNETGYSGGLKLGLDLRGGSYLVLEADENILIQDYSSATYEAVRNTLNQTKIKYFNLRKDNNLVVFSLVDSSSFSSFKKNILEEFDNFLDIVLSGNSVKVSLSPQSIEKQMKEVITNSIEIVRRRIDQTGTNEPSIKRFGGNQIVVELPGVDNPSQIKRIIGTTARLTFHEVDSSATFNGTALKTGYRFIRGSDNYSPQYAIKIEPEIYGKNLVTASLQFQENRPVVQFSLDNEGARKFSALTTKQVGNLLAIVIDNKVISAPSINVPITGGSGIIQGAFSLEEAQELAILLKAGSLPVPLKIVEERVVGPTLGVESIRAGILATIFGYFLVFAFMMVYYKKLGLVANISVLINVFFILSSLSALGATLTLPGIAGIILTIGMAVDANILVYERFAMNMRHNRGGYGLTMSAAFKRVFLTIIDSNLTTLLTAVFLFTFGVGPIRGFSVTLIIGILSSIFGIMFVTRFLINWLVIKQETKRVKAKR